jgi:hypothetical protein
LRRHSFLIPGLEKGVAIDATLGDLSQFVIRCLFFVERLSQQLFGFVFTQELCEVRERTVGGNLVVLDFLRARDQRGIQNRPLQFLHPGLTFFDDAVDPLALLAAGVFSNTLKDLLKPNWEKE